MSDKKFPTPNLDESIGFGCPCKDCIETVKKDAQKDIALAVEAALADRGKCKGPCNGTGKFYTGVEHMGAKEVLTCEVCRGTGKDAARVEVPEDVRETIRRALVALEDERCAQGMQHADHAYEEADSARRWLESLQPAKASEEEQHKSVLSVIEQARRRRESLRPANESASVEQKCSCGNQLDPLTYTDGKRLFKHCTDLQCKARNEVASEPVEKRCGTCALFDNARACAYANSKAPNGLINFCWKARTP